MVATAPIASAKKVETISSKSKPLIASKLSKSESLSEHIKKTVSTQEVSKATTAATKVVTPVAHVVTLSDGEEEEEILDQSSGSVAQQGAPSITICSDSSEDKDDGARQAATSIKHKTVAGKVLKAPSKKKRVRNTFTVPDSLKSVARMREPNSQVLQLVCVPTLPSVNATLQLIAASSPIVASWLSSELERQSSEQGELNSITMGKWSFSLRTFIEVQEHLQAAIVDGVDHRQKVGVLPLTEYTQLASLVNDYVRSGKMFGAVDDDDSHAANAAGDESSNELC